MDASERSKTFFARNPTDYFVKDNWQFLKAGLIEILDKQVQVNFHQIGVKLTLCQYLRKAPNKILVTTSRYHLL